MRAGMYSSRTLGRDLGSEIVSLRNGFQESPRYPHRLRFLTISIRLTALVDTKPCSRSEFPIALNMKDNYVEMLCERFHVHLFKATGLRKIEIGKKIADVREDTIPGLKPTKSV